MLGVSSLFSPDYATTPATGMSETPSMPGKNVFTALLKYLVTHPHIPVRVSSRWRALAGPAGTGMMPAPDLVERPRTCLQSFVSVAHAQNYSTGVCMLGPPAVAALLRARGSRAVVREIVGRDPRVCHGCRAQSHRLRHQHRALPLQMASKTCRA